MCFNIQEKNLFRIFYDYEYIYIYIYIYILCSLYVDSYIIVYRLGLIIWELFVIVLSLSWLMMWIIEEVVVVKEMQQKYLTEFGKSFIQIS